MKLVNKAAMVAVGLVLASSANALVAPTNASTGSDLALIVLNNDAKTAYTVDLGITFSQVIALGEASGQANFDYSGSGPQLLTDSAAQAALSAALNKNLGASDTNLSTFLAATGSKTFEIVAGFNLANSNADGSGQVAYLSTSPANLYNGGTYVAARTSDGQAASYNALPNALAAMNQAIAGANPGSTNHDGKSSGAAQGGTLYTALTSGIGQVTNWFNQGFGTNGLDSTIAVGGAGSGLYVVATNAGQLAFDNSYAANLFSLGTVNLSSAGVLSFQGVSSVPLPAAVWLLGSALLGLAGVGRRRASV